MLSFRFACLDLTYLRQFKGSFWQSVLHLNLSQDIQPMGGVLLKPLSKEEARGKVKKATSFHIVVSTQIDPILIIRTTERGKKYS